MRSSVRLEVPREAGDSRTPQHAHSRTPQHRGTAVDPAEDLHPRRSDWGVSSWALLALGNGMAQEVNLTVPPEDCLKAETGRKWIDLIESRDR